MTDAADKVAALGPGAVAVGGDLYGSVSTGPNYYGAVSVPLLVARLDQAPVLADLATAQFVGRQWLLAELDAFVTGRQCGYLWLEADAGVGKSAFAAWLASTRGYPCHFARQSTGRAGTARQSLAAQLIMDLQLDDLAPNGAVPPWLATPEGFASLLSNAASRAASSRPIVLVLDGLDELEGDLGALPLGLPATLPAGVFVFGTYRTGYHPAVPDSPQHTLILDPADPRNRADLDNFLRMRVAEPPLATVLSEAGIAPEQSVELIGTACHGVWIYARYLLTEIRLGLRAPTDVDELPADLWTYYLRQVQKWRAEPDWADRQLPLVAALAAVTEPVDVDQLAWLSNLPASTVRARCDGPLRPFLTATGRPRRYRIHHATFRQFLSGRTPRSESWPYEHEVVAEELLRATQQAHAVAAGACLSVLDGHLDRSGEDDCGYLLRNLGRHLVASDRHADLHALLARSEESSGHANLWFALHDRNASLDLFLADVARAARCARSAVDAALLAGSPGDQFSLEIRYALIQAALFTRANRIPSRLYIELVAAGIWTGERALIQVQWLTQPYSRAVALGGLAPHLPEDARQPVLDQALAATNQIKDGWDRVVALEYVAPSLPDHQLPEAVRLAESIVEAGPRGVALASLLPYLPRDQRRSALLTVLGMALPQQVAGIVPYLAEAAVDRIDVVDAALEHVDVRADVIAELRPVLPAEYFRPLRVAMRKLGSGPQRQNSVAIVKLAALLPPREQLSRCSAELKKCTDGYLPLEQACRLLPDLIPALPAALRNRAVEAVVELERRLKQNTAFEEENVSDGNTYDYSKALTFEMILAERLVSIASFLPDDMVTRALSVVAFDGRFPPHLLPVAASGLAAKHLPVLFRSVARWEAGKQVAGLVALMKNPPVGSHVEAMRFAEAVPDSFHRASAVAAVVSHLPAGERAPYLTRALDDLATNRIGDALAVVTKALDGNRSEPDHSPAPIGSLRPQLRITGPLTAEFVPEVLIGPAPPPDELTALLAAANGFERRIELAVRYAPALTVEQWGSLLDGSSRMGHALKDVAPHLPAELLPRAMRCAAPYDAAVAVLRRAVKLPTVSRDMMIELVRLGLDRRDLPECLGILAAAAPGLTRLGGPGFGADCLRAVNEVIAWWP
ncbi:hypothetical protein ACFHWS_19140 [Micromonospora sp. LOL_013]|uniref:hypothetical protein n=1 Tax=Micromonospora sp. LOL_013 TaxID=3345414 RepID=UPI003A88D212